MLNHRRAICLMALAGALAAPAAARANAPAGRYVLGNDNDGMGGTNVPTVFDTKTRLTWQQGFFPPAAPPTKPIDPLTHCTDLTTETGVIGWRLPTLKELFTLYDFVTSNGPNANIDDQFFPNTPAAAFLSATSSPLRPVQCLNFQGDQQVPIGCTTMTYVRCVR